MAEQPTKQKLTRRERFLSEMEQAVPWARLVALIEPFYPKGERGRPPLGIERMLRVYFLQQWYALADEALGGCALRQPFHAGLCRRRRACPMRRRLLHFRHLLRSVMN